MRISNNVNDVAIPLSALPGGTPFRVVRGKAVHVKCGPESIKHTFDIPISSNKEFGDHFSVTLSTGKLMRWPNNKKVIPMRASVNVESFTDWEMVEKINDRLSNEDDS